MQRFSLSVGEPWDYEGPDGQNLVVVEFLGVVGGPKKKNWAARSLLLRAITPFQMKGERVEFMVASPRYTGETIESVISGGGTVGVARVRPTANVVPDGSYETTDVEYCIIGSLALLPPPT